jgi:hypothetical protein
MHKISLIAIAAVLILVGVVVEAGAWSVPAARAHAANTGINPLGLMTTKDLPTPHYDDYSLVFPAVIGQ